jgi:hypothetical protein
MNWWTGCVETECVQGARDNQDETTLHTRRFRRHRTSGEIASPSGHIITEVGCRDHDAAPANPSSDHALAATAVLVTGLNVGSLT